MLFILISCEKKIQEIPQKPKVIAPTPVTGLIEKKLEEKYTYRGDIYRDPFVSLSATRQPALEIGEAQVPNLAALSLKGIIYDSKQKIALLSGPMGSYFVREDKIYDSRNRLVKGIKGTISKRSVTLITKDNFVREYKLREVE